MTGLEPYDNTLSMSTRLSTSTPPHTTLPRSPAVTFTDADLASHDLVNLPLDAMQTVVEQPQSPSHNSTMLSADTNMLDSSPTPSVADTSPWVGGTGLGSNSLGKSGKVIERLMTECDRLKRELRSEVAKREELQRSAQTHKDRLDALRAENDRLSNAKTMDDNMIKRRDRKIEELKAELDVERQKRESLEHRVQEAEKKQEDQEQENNERLQRYLEEAKQATTSAAIYQVSHKQLRDEYQQRIATSHRSLKELHDKREEDARLREQDRKKMVKIDVVNHQMSQELEKTRRAHNDLIAASEKDRERKAAQIDILLAEMDVLRHNEQRREQEMEDKLTEMTDTMNKMKWVMNVKKVAKEMGLHSPPPSPPGSEKRNEAGVRA